MKTFETFFEYYDNLVDLLFQTLYNNITVAKVVTRRRKNMKKFITAIVALLVLATLTACGSKAPAGKLTIGTPPLNGDFVAGWGNSAYDKIVRDMIYGNPTYDYTDEGVFVLNKTVVKKEEVTVNDDKSKTYTFNLHKDLKWSDGESITAKDYVFALLFTSSKEYKDAKADNTGTRNIVGWEEYAENGGNFEGVKLIDDHTFSMTIKADSLPYFFEVSYVAASPYPLHTWAPGADIEHGTGTLTFGGDTPDLGKVAEFVSTKERFAPTVTAGMYTFVSYEQGMVTLEIDPNYKGDFEGKKPSVKTVEVKNVNSKLDVDYVLAGDIDIVTGVVEGEKIEKASAAVDAGKAGVTTYERNGYGYLGFHNDFGPVKDNRVRQALAYLIDRNEFVDGILGGYGVTVNGEYGKGQWMYKENEEEIEETLINYVYDTDKAKELLDQTEWKFDSAGAPWSGTGYRYNEKGDKLTINHAGSEDNPITDLISSDLVGRFEKGGIELVVDHLDFNVMLDYFYNDEGQQEAALGARKYHSFNLASTFAVAFDPYYSYHSDYYGTWMNTTQTNDPKFDELTEKMRDLDPNQKDEFSATWLEFQVYWNEQLPNIPLYSNQYYDIYGANLKDVNTTPFYGIGRAIIDVKFK